MALSNNPNIWKIMAGILISIVLLFYLFYYFASIFIVFIFAFILIFLSQKIMKLYHKILINVNISKLKKKIIGYTLVLLSLFLLISVVSTSVSDIVEKFGDPKFGDDPLKGIYEQNIQPFLGPNVEKVLFSQEAVNSLEETILSYISSAVSKIGAFILSSLLIVPLTFYIYFKKKNKIKKSISVIMPKKFLKPAVNASREISNQMRDFFNAKMLQSVIIAILSSIGFFFIGLEGWLFLGILAGLLNIVPYIGPILGMVLPVLVAITHSLNSVYMVIAITSIVQLIDNLYLTPFMVSGKVQMDALLTIILILVAAKLFGVFGMIFIIPMFLVGKIIMTQSYRELTKLYD